MTDVLITAELGEPNPDLACVNSFAIHTEGAMDAGKILVAFDSVNDFYEELAAGQTGAVGGYLHSAMSHSANACPLKMYDLTGTLGLDPAKISAKNPNGLPYSHGSPVAESTMTLPAAIGAINLPTQTAAVLTLRGRGAIAAPVEGAGDIRPRSRLSGRLFLGSLNLAAVTQNAGSVVRPGGQFMTDVMLAAESMQDQLNAAGMTWCVWSRTSGTMHAVTRVEIDDSLDVLRSRKYPPSVRNERTFVPVPDLALGA